MKIKAIMFIILLSFVREICSAAAFGATFRHKDTAALIMFVFTIIFAITLFWIRRLAKEIAYRKKAEKLLGESESRFEALLDNIPDLAWLKDKSSRFIAVNEPFGKSCGASPEDLVGKTDSDIWPPDLADRYRKDDREVMDSGIRKCVEEPLADKQGKVLWIETVKTPMFDEKGEVIGTAGIARDITERKKMEESLRKSEEKYRNLIENMDDVVYVLDPKGFIIYISPVVKSVTGFVPEEVIGRHITEFVHGEDFSILYEQFEKVISGKKAPILEYRMFKKSGELFWARVSSRPNIEDGVLGNVQGILTDITERKRVEQEIIKAKDAAEAATLAKSEFLANMSHEIRTPMNSVLGFLQLTLEYPELPEFQRKNLDTAYNSAKSLLVLLNDILDISKLESGKLELENQTFDLTQLVRDTLTTFEIRCGEKGLDLSFDISPDISRYHIGDPVRLRQIIINLVSNAVKFTEKGTIRLEVGGGEAGRVRFSVSDTGIGIPADRVDKIFEPFTQADSSTSRRFGGTGLGTTISKQLVELMGGEIRVRSEEGKGTSFHFTVRMEPAESGHWSDDSSQSSDLSLFANRISLPAVKRCFGILIAEDIEENITLAKIRFEQHGHTVIVARNGFEAVHAYRNEDPDIILMDVHMPGMDGIEAVRQIRESETESGKRVPIIALTASVMKEDRHKYLQAGIDAVVGKPIDFEELFATMEKIVPAGRGKASPAAANEAACEDPLWGISLQGIDSIKGLRTWMNPKAYKKALMTFCRDYADMSDRLANLIRNGGREGAYRLVHSLKGVSGNLSITEVFRIASELNAGIREKPADELIAMIGALGAAMKSVILSLRQFEAEEPMTEDGIVKEAPDLSVLKELFRKMLVSFEEYNPDAAEPFLEQLSRFLSSQQIEPIRRQSDRFDFEKAREETVKLAGLLGVEI